MIALCVHDILNFFSVYRRFNSSGDLREDGGATIDGRGTDRGEADTERAGDD